ncbi:abortive infection protein [Serratia plymuthica]|uniref:abortive infection protein n=1 Tax=Serratia plymuthica TaxID=82996 RepID=UPI001F53083C|nr:abortive infection protein [Serratia plymuthica]UNK26926.1 abortive infection protein [Serratia plymuthica]
MRNYLFLAILFFSSTGVVAGMTVSVVSAPDLSYLRFKATVSGGPGYRQPNPCYGVVECYLSFFTIDEGWLPGGMSGYSTYDTAFSSYHPANQYRYLDEWWADVTNKHRVGEDSLPKHLGDRPCVVVAAGAGRTGMIKGTIVSNCAKGIVQAKSCEVKPNTINVDLHAALGGATPTVDVDDVTLTCTADASVLIETNSGERIPLGGSSSSYALLDWGAGFGKPKTVKALRDVAEKLPLRIQGVGLDLLGAGQFMGSAIVNVSYN